MEKTDNYFCLAHLALKDKDYQDYFKQKAEEGKHVILDNGAAEGSLVKTSDLMDLLDIIKPTEVIAPDILFDCDRTLEKLNEFCRQISRANVILMGVPQGDDVESYLSCYLEMLRDPKVQTIGLSKLAIPKSFSKITDSNSVSVNRRYLIKLLNELGLIKKPLHLLGMRNITEYDAYKNIPLVRSSDSCFTVLSVINDVEISKDIILDTISETPEEYFNVELTIEQLNMALSNINELTGQNIHNGEAN